MYIFMIFKEMPVLFVFVGVANNVPVVSTVTGIDALSPSSKEDFTELTRLLKEKISPYERSVHYSGFLESLFRDLCISCESLILLAESPNGSVKQDIGLVFGYV